MNSLQSFLDKMGSNFLVAAFIPALGFVSVLMFSFQPVFPPGIISRLEGVFNPLGQPVLVALLLTVMLGFTLSSLSTYIYKIYEGYILSGWLKWARKKEIRREQKIEGKIRLLDRKIQRVRLAQSRSTEANSDNRLSDNLESLLAARAELEATRQFEFPPAKKYVLPTRFGNILRAAESYPRLRYGIDAVPMWPRLAYVIPDQYMTKIDLANNQCSFLLNSSLLATIYSILSVFVAVYQGIIGVCSIRGITSLLYFIPINLTPVVYFQRLGVYLVIAFVAVLCSALFYQASIYNINRYGNMIRSAYDLFRFDLLRALNFALPETTGNEYQEWQKICEFINVGFSPEDQEADFNMGYVYDIDKEHYEGTALGTFNGMIRRIKQ